jgi:hypothetical protein
VTTVIGVEFDATSWVKTHGRYQSMSALENHYRRRAIARPGGKQKLQVFTNFWK